MMNLTQKESSSENSDPDIEVPNHCSNRCKEDDMKPQDDIVNDDKYPSAIGGCCGWLRFCDVNEAKGYSRLAMGRGPSIMSNIFLSTSLIYLASESAGCMDENGNVIDNCDKRIYGFKPSSLITNIAVLAGVISAFFMPIIGAMLDYTPYRRLLGILSAFFMIFIFAVQIGTVSETWYAMGILQAFGAFSFQVQVLATYAYLPEIARVVGEKHMTGFSSLYTMIQFGSQASFLILVVAIGQLLGLNAVKQSMVSQTVNVLWGGSAYFSGWRLMPKRAANHELKAGQNLLTAGFTDIWNTAISINKHYAHGLRYYFLALAFAEAGSSAFTVVSIVYLDEILGMSVNEIGLTFLITLLSSIPGSIIGRFITNKTNPNTSWKLSMCVFIIFTAGGVFALTSPERKNLAFLWAVFWGLAIGWFYPAENLFFAMALPKGREAELSGFYVYCTQILVWLPPLVFTAMNETGVHQKWGLMSMNMYFVVSIALLMCVAPWPDVIKEASKCVDDASINNEESSEKKTSEQNNNIHSGSNGEDMP